jgi:4-amino-4-deoxy-L-arabinose transferase-like glycosyltransferase
VLERPISGGGVDLPGTTTSNRQDMCVVLALLAVGVLLVVIYAVAFGRYASPWMGDAARYVEGARSRLRGEPLYNRLDAAAPRPMYLWPPGFSMLIAITALTGISVLTSAYLLSCAAVTLVLPGVYWAFYPALGRPLAFVTAALCFTSPGLLANANLVATESLFLLIVILAFGAVIRGWFFTAGLLVGGALLVRNTGLAVLPGLALASVIACRSLREQARHVGTAIGGFAVPFFALSAWNLWAHHTLAPYTMPPSTHGLRDTLRDMGQSITFAVVPSEAISHLIPWPLPLFFAGAVCLACCTWAVVAKRGSPVVRRALAVTSCFVVVGIAVTVAGRVRYEWGAEISVRHASQYEWLLLPLGAALALGLLPRRRRLLLAGTFGAAAIVVGLRVWETADHWVFLRETDRTVGEAVAVGTYPPSDVGLHLEWRQFFRHYERVADLHSLARQIAPSCVIVSNLRDLLLALDDVAVLGAGNLIPNERDVVSIQGLLPPAVGQSEGAHDPQLMPIGILGLPPSIRVFSNAPARCLPEVLVRRRGAD